MKSFILFQAPLVAQLCLRAFLCCLENREPVAGAVVHATEAEARVQEPRPGFSLTASCLWLLLFVVLSIFYEYLLFSDDPLVCNL